MNLLTNLTLFWRQDEAGAGAIAARGQSDLAANNGVVKSGTDGWDYERDSSQFHSIADSSEVSSGDIDFTFSCVVNAESFGAAGDNLYIISKADAGSGDEYRLLYRGFGGGNRFRFSIIHSGGTEISVDANNLGAPSTATDYLIVAWHDAAANTINIQVNDGTVDSQSTAGNAPTDGGGAFHLGAYHSSTPLTWDGTIRLPSFWKNRILTSGERTYLYNGGNFRKFAEYLSDAGTGGGLVIGSSASFVGEGYVGSTEAAAGTGTTGVATVAASAIAPAASGTGTGTATTGVATVAISAIAPAVSGAGSVTATSGVATVAVSAISPAASPTGSAPAVSGVATVAVAATSPAASGQGTGTATPGVATVAASAVAPAGSGTGTATATPGVATVAVSGISPTVSATGSAPATPGVATVVVSTTSPDASTPGGGLTATSGVATVAVSAIAPAASGTGSGTCSPQVAVVQVVAVNCSATPAGAATALTGVAVVNCLAVSPTVSKINEPFAPPYTAFASESVPTWRARR